MYYCVSIISDVFLQKILAFGQPIGAIIADTREVAQRAVSLVNVLYEEMKPILTIEVQCL
jgi:xanthine dehydrogenase molybdopterin-binding subunit B